MVLILDAFNKTLQSQLYGAAGIGASEEAEDDELDLEVDS
jgi:hypothetical protein